MDYPRKYLFKLSERKKIRSLREESKEISFPDPQKENKRSRRYSFFGVSILILFSFLIFFGIRVRKNREIRGVYLQEIEKIKGKINESVGLYEENIDKSRDALTEAKNIANKLKESGVFDNDLKKLTENIGEIEIKTYGEHNVSSDLFVDLKLLSENYSGKTLSFSNDTLFVLDQENRKIAKVDIISKRSEMVAGPNTVDEVITIASYVERLFLLKKNGIFEYDAGKLEKVGEGEFDDKTSIYAYGGNLYTLNKADNEIYRYSSLESGFAPKSAWLAESASVDFSDVIDLTIDGAVWVLKEGGRIEKYVYGNPQNFRLLGNYVGLKNSKYIFTEEEEKFLYLLDEEGGKVLAYDKQTGSLSAQYICDDIKGSVDFVVSEAEKKIILLKKDRLLVIEI